MLFGMLGAVMTPGAVLGQAFEFKPNQRYPDPSVQILDPSFTRYRLFSSSVEQLASGFRWAEGPVGSATAVTCCSATSRTTASSAGTRPPAAGVFRHPSNFSNGLARDRQGRLPACEHLTRRVTRTEYDGASRCLPTLRGKRLNSPNDIVCRSDGSIWFTDPPFGIGGHWEGDKATPELPHSVYRIDAGGQVRLMIDDLAGPTAWVSRPTRRSSTSSKAGRRRTG